MIFLLRRKCRSLFVCNTELWITHDHAQNYLELRPPITQGALVSARFGFAPPGYDDSICIRIFPTDRSMRGNVLVLFLFVSLPSRDVRGFSHILFLYALIFGHAYV